MAAQRRAGRNPRFAHPSLRARLELVVGPVTFWRAWAARRGVDPDELQYRGQNASLLWPRGHFFEKTELGNALKRLRRAP